MDEIARDGGESVVTVQKLQLSVEHVERFFLVRVNVRARPAARGNRGLDETESPIRLRSGCLDRVDIPDGPYRRTLTRGDVDCTAPRVSRVVVVRPLEGKTHLNTPNYSDADVCPCPVAGS